MPVYEAYAAQWGSMSHALGSMRSCCEIRWHANTYSRNVRGRVAPSPDLIHQATDAVAALSRYQAGKPGCSRNDVLDGASAVADWRANGLDLETVAKQGYLDIWVDQTWAGAWNEVGLRDGAFWNSRPGLDLPAWLHADHAAILADTKVPTILLNL